MRTSPPPLPAPRVVGERGTVLLAAHGVGRAALDGDVWEIRYPHNLLLHAGQAVRIVGQRRDVLLVLPAALPPQSPPHSPKAPTRPTKGGRRR
jgi:membrane protein implicated in regulation of membrane protease activity